MYRLYLFLIILFGFILRASFLDKGVIWYDEIGSIAVAKQDFPLGILDKLYNEDFHAPLYYFILHFWMKIFGESEVVLRLFSAVAGTLVLPVLYFAGKELKDNKTGLLAAFLASFHPLLLYYSQEIRHYGIGILFASLSVLFLVKFLKSSGTKSLSGLIAANLCLMYTISVLGVIFVFIESVSLLLFLFINKKNIKIYLISQFVCILLFIPYFPVLLHHISVGSGGFLNPFWWNKFEFMDILLSINNLFSPLFIYSSADNFSLLLFGGFAILGCYAFIFYLSAIDKAVSKNKLIVLLFSIAVIFYLSVIGLAFLDKIALMSKYTILVCPVLCLIAAYGFFCFKSKRMLVLLIIFSAISIYIQFFTSFSVTKKPRDYAHAEFFKILKEQSFDKNDLIITDWGARFISDYYKTRGLNIFAEFDLEKALAYNDRGKLNAIFDENILNGLDKTNAHDRFRNYLLSEEIPYKFEIYVENSIIKKLDKSSKLAVLIWYKYPANNQIKQIATCEEVYSQKSIYPLISNKTMYNLTRILDKHLKRIPLENEKYYKIYLWEKI